MSSEEEYKLKFELDIRGLERSILPYMVLKTLSQSDPLSGIRVKDSVVESFERIVSFDLLQENAPSTKGECFEFHVSTLYPLLDYMRGRGWVNEDAPPYKITTEGKKMLKKWQTLLDRFQVLMSSK